MNLKVQAENQIKKYKQLISGNNLLHDEIIQKPYNFEFSVRQNDTKSKVKIQVYFGKKGVTTILQGNKETDYYKLVDSILFGQQKLNFNEEKEKDFSTYIGSDETGKGDVFGPLVVCAYYCEDSDKEYLRGFGVRDSKELSAYQIIDIAETIINKFQNNFSVVMISPEKYNALYDEFKNLNKLLNWAHTKAISNLLEMHPCENIIVDKFSNESLLLTNKNKLNIIHTHKAERYVAVAAASIIARYYFDLWFKNHKKFSLPKGASAETAQVAEKIFDNYGIGELNKIAKLHFKSVSSFLK